MENKVEVLHKKIKNAHTKEKESLNKLLEGKKMINSETKKKF